MVWRRRRLLLSIVKADSAAIESGKSRKVATKPTSEAFKPNDSTSAFSKQRIKNPVSGILVYLPKEVLKWLVPL